MNDLKTKSDLASERHGRCRGAEVRPFAVRCLAVLLLVFALFPWHGLAQSETAILVESEAAKLMGKKLYTDAIRVLEKEINGPFQADHSVRYWRLGECYYMLGKYAEARPWFEKANKNLTSAESRMVAQYRLVCIAYKLAEMDDALKNTEAFVREFPDAEQGGKLLVMKMKALAERGASATAELEALRKRIGNKYGGGVSLAAEKQLTDFYLATGAIDKAMSGFQGIVDTFRKAQAQAMQEKRPVPPDMLDAYDYAALQLGWINIKTQRETEAVKWLESVRYNTECIQKAKLMLANIAYEKRDYTRAKNYLLENNLVEKVESIDLRAEMYLVLGFCAKKSPQPKMEEVFSYFGKVAKESRRYAQAQMGMADTALKWRQPDAAVEHFENASVSAGYAAEAFFNLGTIYLEAAEKETDAVRKQELLKKAADRFNSLTTKHSTSRFTQEAKPAIDKLMAQGFEIKLSVSDDEVIQVLEETVKKVPGTPQAARALLSIARAHQKSSVNPKTKLYDKAPDFAGCVEACNRLLAFDGNVLPPAEWKAMRAEAFFFRGISIISSVGRTAGGRLDPEYVKNADLQKGLADLEQAQNLTDPREFATLRNIEIARLEGLFKSDVPEQRQTAERLFTELRAKYGQEPRLQKVAADLAKWRLDKKEVVAAADLYKDIADRAGDEIPRDDIVKVFFTAGKLYSYAAQEARDRGGRTFVILIQQKEVVPAAGLLETHRPFRTVVRLGGVEGELTAEEALRKLSQASKIPFVWDGKAALDLRTRRVKLAKNVGTVSELLGQIVDFRTQGIAFDAGFTRGKPTLPPSDVDEDASPEEKERGKTIEVYARGDWAGRFEAVSKSYGVWSRQHPGPYMFLNVFKRLEEGAKTRILWGEGINREDVLAEEGKSAPQGINPANNVTFDDVLTALLDPRGLEYSIVARNASDELYEKAKQCFNEVRKLSPKSPEGEESLYILAMNYYRQEDYTRMKLVLQEYLKIFDGPNFSHYLKASYWVGWVNERDRQFRDAIKYYERAAQEYVTIYRPGTNEPAISKEAMAERMSYDTRFAFDEPINDTITNMPFGDKFLDFVRLNTSVDVRMDSSASDILAPVDIGAVKDRKMYDIFWDVLTGFGLAFKVANVDAETAERAYYRLAFCLKQDDQHEQSLATCRTLMTRYKGSKWKREIQDLYTSEQKALKDYRGVLKDLADQKARAANPEEALQADYALAWAFMDLRRYNEAADLFKKTLSATRDDTERLAVREGYARALARLGKPGEALDQYEMLVKEETSALRLFIDEMMVWSLRREAGKSSGRDLPASAETLLRQYEAADAQARDSLDKPTLTKVTWAYYVRGLYDLLRRDEKGALAQFEVAANSPDDWVAGDALLRSAILHRQAKRLKESREALELLLFSSQSTEAEVEGLRMLSDIANELADTKTSKERMGMLLDRYPDSAPAMQVMRERAEKKAKEAAAAAATNAPAAKP
jgi:tetratricopeptide (TPR) repeat protein